ncbi:MAG: formyltransferase family protein [Acidobacteriota bacterium]
MKIAVLCTDDPHQQYLVSELERRFGLVGVVLERNRSQRSRLWRRRRYRAWLYRIYHMLRARYTGSSRHRREFFLSQVPAGETWPEVTVEVPWVNNKQARGLLAEWQPDVTIVSGTGILRRSLLAHTGFTINIHGGCLPEYKGNHGVFFAFLEGRFDQIAATLHLVTPGLDEGPILEVVRPPIYPHDHDEALYSRSVYLAMRRLFALLERMRDGWRPAGAPQASVGRTFRHRDRKPLLELGLWLRRRTGRHPVPHRPAAPDGDGATFE